MLRSCPYSRMISITLQQLTDLADSLGLFSNARDRRDCAPRFSRSETTRLLRIADVLARVERLLGDRNRGLQWIRNENRALDFKSPLAHLETIAGTKRVLALLRRMEDGRFA